MHNIYRKTASFLTLAGTIPFLAYLIIKLKDPDGITCTCFKIEYLKVYSLMLIAFISGCIWAYSYQKQSAKLAILAIIGSIIPWLNYIFNHSEHYFVVDMVYYVALLFIEEEKFEEHNISRWYYKLRILATTIVVISLIGITYFKGIF